MRFQWRYANITFNNVYWRRSFIGVNMTRQRSIIAGELSMAIILQLSYECCDAPRVSPRPENNPDRKLRTRLNEALG